MTENKNLFGFDGVIGRRNFILNYLIIAIIMTLITMVVNYIVIINSLTSYLPYISISARILTVFLLYPSIERRLLDISLSKDKGIMFYINLSLIILLLCMFPVFNIFIILMLLIYRGHSDRANEQNHLTKFNWGAFLGTWLWGIWNKVPQTLLMIPLFFTPAGFAFALICGIKGNEWAYKQDTDEANFHRRQENQTIFWAIAAPIIFVLSLVCFTFVSGKILTQYEKTHPGTIETKIESIVDYSINVISDIKFSKIEKTQSEYQFYISPKEWSLLSEKNKYSLFVIALYKSVLMEDKKTLKSELNLGRISKVTIYSDFNNEILAKFNADKETDLNLIPDDIGITLKNHLEINTNPTTP